MSEKDLFSPHVIANFSRYRILVIILFQFWKCSRLSHLVLLLKMLISSDFLVCIEPIVFLLEAFMIHLSLVFWNLMIMCFVLDPFSLKTHVLWFWEIFLNYLFDNFFPSVFSLCSYIFSFLIFYCKGQQTVAYHPNLACHMPHLFTYCLWLLSHCHSRVEWLQQRPYGLQSLNYLFSGPLQKKFADSCSTGC